MDTRRVVIAVALLLLPLVGCSGGKSGVPAPDSASAVAPAPAPAQSPVPASAGEPSPPSPETASEPVTAGRDPSGVYGHGGNSGSAWASSHGTLVNPPITTGSHPGAWCDPGLTYKGSGGSVAGLDFKIIGMAEFKGKQYCKGEYRMGSPGQEMVYTLYFTEDGTGGWVVMNVSGRVQEIDLSTIQ